jgi:beta-ribofuranosylaminobenzene 5'-phosphate synthase
MGICIPPIQNKTEDEEKVFFDKNCPIGQEAVENILYESVYGISSSLLENDFNTFCKSVDSIQETKWKSLERDLYGDELKMIELIIKKAGAKCVGMSSLGPLLYFFGEDVDSIANRVNADLAGGKCFKTSFNNSGRILEYD